LELLDPAFDETLLLACRVVLGVLLQVAVRTRLRDRGDHGGAPAGLEVFEFGSQALRATGRPGCSHAFLSLSSACSSCSDQTGPESRKSSECSRAFAPAMVVE